jgi:hypothetical protein
MPMKQTLFILPALALLGVTAFAGYTTNAAEMENNRPSLTNEQKEILQEIRELKQNGQYEEARELAEDANLPMRKGRKAPSEEMQKHREQMHSIIESGDYQAFLDAVEDTPMVDIIDSEDKFNILVEAHELRESGDFEGAKELMFEAGLQKSHRMHRGSLQ